MEIYLIAKLLFRVTMICLVVYMLIYLCIEKYLRKWLKESSYLKIMPISNRITAFVTSYVICLGPLHIAEVVILLAHSKKLPESNIFFLVGYSIVMYGFIRHRLWNWNWYYLTKPTRTILANFYMQKYFALDNDKKHQEAYHCLKKASEIKTDSVFIWSMMALFNEQYFEKSELADEYLANAKKVLNAASRPSPQDKALVEAIAGDILLCRDNIDQGLALLKNACEIDPSAINKERYEKALKWANEDEKSETS